MLPSIHFNFGPTTFDRFYQAALPLIPGGVLAGGLLIERTDLSLSFRNALGLGTYSSFAALVFVAYVLGFVLFGWSAILAGVASGIVQGIVFRFWTPARSSWLLSQDIVWRRVAAEFLGNDLAPKLRQTPPGSSAIEKITAPMKQLASRQQHDAEWEEWYRILQDYLLRKVPLVSSEMAAALVGLQATGWAIVVLTYANPYMRHWVVFVVAPIVILFGIFFPFMAILNYHITERLSYWDFTARLLAEVRAREAHRIGTSEIKNPGDPSLRSG